MVPQLIIASWLSFTSIMLGAYIYEKSGEEEGSVIISIIYIAIPIAALWHADFWIIK
jgi:hypothetical protein